MLNGPLISIITPVYNLESYIEQTIQSVLKQTYQNWEWIIIDDGSTDNTREIINSYTDKRITYHYQTHYGIEKICLTHNKALSMSRGELIALIDGDDLWPEYKLEKHINSFTDERVVLSYGECCLINPKGRKIDYINIHPDTKVARNDPVGSALKEFLFKPSSFIYNPTVIVRRSALVKIGGFTMYNGLAHDFPTWCRLSLEGKFDPIPLCLGYWRKHNKSVSFQNVEYRFRNMVKFVNDFSKEHNEKIESFGLGFKIDNIHINSEENLNSFLNFIPYDKAMLMVKIGMFREAKKEVYKYLGLKLPLKNRLIIYLIYISTILNYDIVNPVRKLKENFDYAIKKLKFWLMMNLGKRV